MVLPCVENAMQSGVPNPLASVPVVVQHRISGFSESWTIEDVPVPEGVWHDRVLSLLMALLDCWIVRTSRGAAAFRNLAVRVRKDRPQVGFDPDVMVVEPAPPGALELASLRLWEPERAPPALAVEVVSPGHPYKDYTDTPDRCAALGVRELVVFDPMHAGPRAFGGPHLLQGWRRTDAGTFARDTAGEQPFFSAVLGAYFVPNDASRLLRISNDEAGTELWPTAEEAERAAKEAERAAKERALARVAELEAELSRGNR
jgi:Uma2 family endonuclease